MSKYGFAAVAISALALATPAAAQYGQSGYPQQRYGQNAAVSFEARIERLEARLRAGIDQRTISPDEARLLEPQLRRLRDMHRRYAADGLSREERQDLQQQLRELRRQMRIADGGGWDRYDPDDAWRDDGPGYGQGYGRGDWIDRDNDGYDDRDFDRDGRWEDDLNSRIDRDNDGWDDRDYDRDGRWDDDVAEGRYGHAPAAPPVEDRGIVGALIDTFLGGAAPTLRVGDRAPDNLYGVPYQYQDRYRDGYGVYFRSDGRAIYEIDARSRTVVRVHPMPR